MLSVKSFFGAAAGLSMLISGCGTAPEIKYDPIPVPTEHNVSTAGYTLHLRSLGDQQVEATIFKRSAEESSEPVYGPKAFNCFANGGYLKVLNKKLKRAGYMLPAAGALRAELQNYPPPPKFCS